MSPTTSPVVVLERLGRRFGAQVALAGVTACIRPGEFVAIIGRSGAGKTTLLRCLSRAIVPTEGAIRMGGQDLRPLAGAALRGHRARVGVIYQQFNLVKRLRVLDNVLVGRLPHLRGWRRYAALARVFDRGQRDAALSCLDHVGLLARAWQRTDTLSEAGGLLTGERGSPLFPLDPDGYHGEAIAFLAGDPLAHDQARRDLLALA